MLVRIVVYAVAVALLVLQGWLTHQLFGTPRATRPVAAREPEG